MNVRRGSLIALCLLATNTIHAQTPPDWQASWSAQEIMIPARDGTKLHTVFYVPKGKSGKFPILLERTPYGAGNVSRPPRRVYDLIKDAGYILAFQDVRGGVDTVCVPDTLGSTARTITPSTGLSYSAIYWPYGEVRTASGKNPSPWGFVGLLGYFTDFASQLYVRARHYRPTLGRWQTVDPLWPRESMYEYVGASPTTIFDPSGKGYRTPEQCELLLKKIQYLASLLANEFGKYNPFTDMLGGDCWKPYGHLEEILNLQRGIMNALADYARDCWYKGPPPPPSPPLLFWPPPVIRPGGARPKPTIPGYPPGIPGKGYGIPQPSPEGLATGAACLCACYVLYRIGKAIVGIALAPETCGVSLVLVVAP